MTLGTGSTSFTRSITECRRFGQFRMMTGPKQTAREKELCVRMCFHVFKNKKREGFQRKTFPFLFRILACVYTKGIDQPSEIAPTGH